MNGDRRRVLDLDRITSALSGADVEHFVDGSDEYLPVTHPSGACAPDDRVHNSGGVLILHDDLELQMSDVLLLLSEDSSRIDRGHYPGTSSPLHFFEGEPADAYLLQRRVDLFEPLTPYDSLNFLQSRANLETSKFYLRVASKTYV